MKQQTAVEWLEEQINLTFYVAESSEMSKRFQSIFEQSKQMDKEQKIDFANWCRIHDNKYPNQVWTIHQLFEKYYNETYGKQEINKL